MKNDEYAFTLIELLIVVAIIAILAAIAVPNFMEAQVRAKVSQAKANLRTMATAVECYRIDTGVYPPLPLVSWVEEVAFPFMLTTPISYVSGSIEDPFAAQALGSSDRGMALGLTCLFYWGGLRDMMRGMSVDPERAHIGGFGNPPYKYHQTLFPREFWERYRYTASRLSVRT